MNGWMSMEILGNPPLRWALAALVAVLAATVLGVILRVLRRRVEAWARQSPGLLDDGLAAGLGATRGWFVIVVALALGMLVLALSPRIEQLVGRIVSIALILQVGLWFHAGIGGWLRAYMTRHRGAAQSSATTTMVLVFVARLVLWSLVILTLFANAGVDVTALVASLGIGGIAVALAAQNILGDLFASLSIALDQPVDIGDFIVMGDTQGTVERVGLKTTHLRSISGELVVVANTDLVGSRISNYKRMFERRVVFRFGVVHATPLEKLQAIPGMVREAVVAQPQARFDRAHLAALGASAIEFETVYFVLDANYGKFMDVQQSVILATMAALQAADIRIAYQTRTLYLERHGAR